MQSAPKPQPNSKFETNSNARNINDQNDLIRLLHEILDKTSSRKRPIRSILEFHKSCYRLFVKYNSSSLSFLNPFVIGALDETPEDSILIDDYLKVLNKRGWQRTHIIQAPMSSERFEAGVVSAMQRKKILGVTNRYVIVLAA